MIKRFFSFRDYSLGAKLIFAFLAVTLIPIAGLAYYNDFTSRQNLTDAADTALNTAAAHSALVVDSFIDDKLSEIRIYAKLYILQEYLSMPPSERPGSETEKALYTDMQTLSLLHPGISSVALLDKRGVDVADTVLDDVGKEKSDRDYFIGAVSSGLPYVTPVLISRTTNQSSIYFSAPVKDARGNLIGVIRVRYDAVVIQELIEVNVDNFTGVGAFAVLFDENYVRLAHTSAPELILKSVVPLPAEKLTELQSGGDPRLPAGTAEELSTNLPDVQKGLENLDAQPIFSADFAASGQGLDQVVGVRLKSRPWTIVFVQAQEVFLAPVQAATRNNLIIAIVVAFLVAAIGFLMAQFISWPIVNLTAVAQKIAGGDFSAQAAVTSKDEVGTLAATFNDMTAQIRQRTKAVETSIDVSRRISSILDLGQLVTEVVGQLQSAFNYYHAHIYLLDEAGENLNMAGGTGEAGKTLLERGHSIPRGRGLVGRAAESKEFVLVPDTTKDPNWLSNPLLPETKSEIAVPILAGDQVLGVLDVQNNVAESLGQQDADLIRSIANQVAVAVTNIRQYEKTIATAAELAGIQGAVSEAAIIATTDVSGKIETVNENFVRISKYSREELIGQDHRLLNSGYQSKEFIRDLWVTIANGKVWRKEIKNKAKDGSLYWVDTTISPILNEFGKPVKYMAVRFDITARKEAEEAIVQRAGQLATVARVSSAAATILDTDKLLQEVVNLTKEQFNLYHSHIYLLNEAGDTLVLAAGAGEPGRQMVTEGRSIPLNREQSLVARAARERQGVIVNDVTQAPDFLANPLLPDTRSELAVPLIVGDKVLGVFDVQSDSVDRFTPEDVNIQSTLASQIAVALQNVRAFSQAQRQAERETTLNLISQKIQSATTVEAVLQIAARELGHALGAPMTIAQLSMKDKK